MFSQIGSTWSFDYNAWVYLDIQSFHLVKSLKNTSIDDSFIKNGEVTCIEWLTLSEYSTKQNGLESERFAQCHVTFERQQQTKAF